MSLSSVFNSTVNGVQAAFNFAAGDYFLKKRGITSDRTNVRAAGLISGLFTISAVSWAVLAPMGAPVVPALVILLAGAGEVALLPSQVDAAILVGKQAVQKKKPPESP